MKKNWKKICLFLILICIAIFALYNIFKIIYVNIDNQTEIKQEAVNNKPFSEQENVINEGLQIVEKKDTNQVAKQSVIKESSNKQSDLKELVANKQITNISECSDEFMNKYFTEVNALNEKISKEDEETKKNIKSNMLIVTSKEENINSYGASQTIKAPNNQYILVYDNKEKMEQAKIDLNNDNHILDVDNNNVYEINQTNENDMSITKNKVDAKQVQIIKNGSTQNVEQLIKQKVNNNLSETESESQIQTNSKVQSTYNSWGVEATGLDIAKDIANTKSLEEVTVAIIDTGCDIDLLESYYPNKVKGTYDVLGNSEFTDEIGHGTHIAGTISEATPDNVKIYPVKVTDSNSMYDSDIILAINYIVYNDLADVINMSFGGYYQSESMYTAIEAANSKNIICVAAAGNDNVSSYCYPASYDNTISIAACTKTLGKASFSNYNDLVTFTAPGLSILSINGTSSGTSMATPHAVSAVAIYKSYNKNYTLENVIDGLKMYCTDLGDEGKDRKFGYGLINLKDIVYCDCNCESCSEIYCLECDCKTCTNTVKEVSGIEITSPVEVLTYNYGSITNLSNVLVNIKYSDDSEKQVNLLELEDCQISGYNPYSYEEQTITITYKEKTTTFKLNVESEYEMGWEYELNGEETVKLTGFKEASDMEKIYLYIPEKIEDYIVTELGDNLLYEQENLVKVVLTNNINTIGNNVFYLCSKLKNVELENNLTSIGDGAFYQCNLIESLEIPQTVTSIGNNTFYNCTKLSNINIPNNVKEIGENAFSYTAITKLELPEGIETIKQGTFTGCYSLQSITLPESLKTIESKSFYECTNLQDLAIPANVTTINEDAFVRCSNIWAITVDSLNKAYDSRENCNAIIETNTNKLIVGGNDTVIPEDVVTIGANSFSGRINLAYIQVPEGVTTIEANAFAKCAYLQIVILPSTITSIETNSFTNCPYLVLYVYQDSYSEEYAINNNIDYEYLDNFITNIYLYNYTPVVYKAFDKVAMDGVQIGVDYANRKYSIYFRRI